MSTKFCPNCGARVSGKVCDYCNTVFEEDAPKVEPSQLFDQLNKWNDPVRERAVSSFRIAVIIVTVTLILALTAGIAAFTAAKNKVSDKKSSGVYGNDYLVSKDGPVGNAEPEKGIFPAGTYKIGSQIPEGLYILVGNKELGNFPAGIYNDPEALDQRYTFWGNNTAYMVVEGKGYVHFNWATAYDVSKNDVENDPFTHQGVFRVGKGLDLEPGTYTAVSDNSGNSGRWCIYYGITEEGPDQKDFGWVDHGDRELTVEEGEYLSLTFCHLEKQ